MHESRLREILADRPSPPADEDAKKRAVNLALSAFDAAQHAPQKKFQAFSLLGRLTGRSPQQQRKKPMSITLNNPGRTHGAPAYAGVAVALTAVLVGSLYLRQTETTPPLPSAPANTEPRPIGRSEPGRTASTETFTAAERPAETEAVEADQAAAVVSPAAPSAPSILDGRQVQPVPAGAGGRPVAQADRQAARIEAEMTRERLTADERRQRARLVAEAQRPALEALVTERDELARKRASAPALASAPAEITAADSVPPPAYRDVGRDRFEDFRENPVTPVAAAPVSTFSVDVDSASYAFVRRQLNAGVLPQKDAVRVEELINYFDYDYPLPADREQPFRPTVSVVPSPWKAGNKLIHIGIKGYDIAPEERPRSNLVFLLDVSGSMNSPDKLPLLVNSMKLLLDALRPDDTVGIVVYAGAAGTVLEPTRVSDKGKIIDALQRLRAGGSTAGGEGIRQAYQLAERHYDEDAVNRVILATDGDFNVGVSDPQALQDFIERKRETGIFLSVLGFGQGNLNDRLMQTLAQNGNGVAAYIDTLSEARKVLVDEAGSTLFPIAKDVKIQLEFNPATVAEYRLVGYETRHLNREDFNNDAVDAGDIGAGHTVTALYEITPVGGPRAVDESRYATPRPAPAEAEAVSDLSNEYAFLKIRYKLPDEDTSRLLSTPITLADETVWEQPDCPAGAVCEASLAPAPNAAGWATAVATFGQLLKGGRYTGSLGYDDVIALGLKYKGDDEFGYRAELINLARLAKSAAALGN